ncbi:MAG: inorganic phosphate transporter [Alphaproteobacteria bacterium]|nr:inorganic phosphate transporter [Alphaproteobacteria bacterium]
MYKETLTKDLVKFDRVGAAAIEQAGLVPKLGLALLFLLIVWVGATIAYSGGEQRTIVIIAGIIGGYMALNIGANDVANNVGAAVGSRALTLMGALIIASIFEAMGAIVAGGDVVGTISKGIIAPEDFPNSDTFIWCMLSALLAAALWVNIATMVSAPVSTTHSIVGGVVGAGIAAVGFSVVNWPKMGMIAASWVISPVLGGVIAAIFLAFIKANIIYKDDKIAGARRWVPILVALMAGGFSAYLVMKGLKGIWKPEPWVIVTIGVVVFAVAYVIVNPLIRRQADGMENRNKSVRTLFIIPLICSAALLSFAHGSNDVANAVGPLAAIVGAAESGQVAVKVEIPLWVMFIGAAGLSAGLLLFGPKLIRVVGQQITRMNPMRAYCVALSAAITVIIASGLGLPVSSTHIAVGAVFGVGFYREWQTGRRTHINHGRYGEARKTKGIDPEEQALRRKLVRRSHLTTIVAAWVITVPASAVIAGGTFLIIQAVRGM